MSSRGMFRNAQKGIKAKQLDAEGNEVSFDVREDEEMVRCGVLPICALLWCRGTRMNTTVTYIALLCQYVGRYASRLLC